MATRPAVSLLSLTHPGVGPVTALATEVFLGDPTRFADGKAVASYIGMIPSERSSGRRQRLGALSRQGNSPLRYLWVESAMHAVRNRLRFRQKHTTRSNMDYRATLETQRILER